MASSTTIKYNNVVVHESTTSETLNLPTNGKLMNGDIEVDVHIDKVVGDNDVEFIDYDGDVVDSYTAAEFAELTALPPNPTHEGLIAQGWNWSLADAKSFVATYGRITIGQNYITDDNTTRLYITLGESRLSPYLGIGVKGTATIDWGDDSTPDTITGSSLSTILYTQHIYAQAGDYVITLTGNVGFGNRTILRVKNTGSADNADIVYASALTKVEVGNMTQLQGGAFYNCYSLSAVTIPNGVTTIGTNVFRSCRALTAIVIPKDVTKIQSSCFYNCYSLTNVSLNGNLTQIQNSGFAYCYSLRYITIPGKVTTLADSCFSTNYALADVLIPDSVTSLGEKAFYSANSLRKIRLSNSLTEIKQLAFQNCYALSEINIPTSLTAIGNTAFQNNFSIANLTFPTGLTSIGSAAFSECNGLGFIRFKSLIPPAVSASTTFQGLPTECIIYVPVGTLTDYTTATNYPSSATYTYVEE